MSHDEELIRNESFVCTYTAVYRTLSAIFNKRLPLSGSEIFKLYCQMKINSFMITDSSGLDLAPGIFPRASRLDHSCFPSTEYIFQGRKIFFIPVSNILTSAEQLINYVDPVGSTVQRREELRTRYLFHCECSLCLDADRDSKITSVFCCDTAALEEPLSLHTLPSEPPAVHAWSFGEPPKPPFVRCCPTCHTMYDEAWIERIRDQLSSFYGKSLSKEYALDALVLYHRLRGVDGPVKNFGLLQISEVDEYHNQPQVAQAHYKLFGHSDNVYLAQICRFASHGQLEENMNFLLTELPFVKDANSEASSLLINTLIACSLDLFDWQTRLLPWSAFATGLQAAVTAGFLLRNVGSHDFISTERMKSIKDMCASSIEELNLAHILSRLILTADKILTPFAPFDVTIQTALDRLRSHL